MKAKDTTLVEKLVKARRDGRQEGRQEVVEWIEKHNDTDAPGKIYSPFEYFRPYIRHSDWQALLEEVK